jgi:ribonuclease VapC
VILDSSAVISVLLREHGHEGLEAKMREATWLGIGAPTLVETRNVMVRRHGMAGLEEADRFLAGLDMAVIPFDARHADVARDASVRFGKGRHPAKLNYGDCMTYATARVADGPLLFIGNDFAQTDIRAA